MMRKPKHKPKRKLSLKINVDLSEWDLGSWPEDITGMLDVRMADGEINVGFKEEAVQSVCRRIAKEAIETFFEDFNVDITEKGLEFSDEGGVKYGAVPLYLMSEREVLLMMKHVASEIEQDWTGEFGNIPGIDHLKSAIKAFLAAQPR